ncbi:MAG TPA: site-2 protease family protein [Polyangiaceae bacterium]
MTDRANLEARVEGESRTPSHVHAEQPAEGRTRRFDWRTNAVLFLLTVLSVFYVGRIWTGKPDDTPLQLWTGAWPFAVPLLAILLVHEFGHYIAARLHRVPASLPYFLPLPVLNPFGTLGAVILMPRRIRSRKALLDIGASGPLAGMALAVPLMIYGLSLSHVGPRGTSNYVQEGQSILYFLLKFAVFGHISGADDVYLHPTALAAWAGFFVTFLNLVPFGQLDGGHVAYALFGERQNRAARWMLLLPPLLMAYNFWVYARPILLEGYRAGFSTLTAERLSPAGSVLNWLVPWVLLLLMRRWVGAGHPPVDETSLGWGRKVVGAVTLITFILVFMPTPMVFY